MAARIADGTSRRPPFLGVLAGSFGRRVLRRLRGERVELLHCVYSLLLVAVVTGIGKSVSSSFIKPTQLAVTYLLTVVIVAARFGLWPAILASAVSVATLDYFFIPPLYSFATDSPQDALLLAILSVGAIVASGLAARLREQAEIAQRNATTTAALCRFAGRLAGTVTLETALRTVVDEIEGILPMRADIVLHGDAAAPVVLPLRSSGETVGWLALSPHGDTAMTAEQSGLVEALSELAGIAIGRHLLADRLAQVSLEQAADRLRSALLNSIAHDLTAPIAALATALGSLTQNYDVFDDASRRELIGEAEGEAEHLHQFSANLLHIARIESGTIELRRTAMSIGELIDGALMRARHIVDPARVIANIGPEVPSVFADPVLIEQAIFHVLENAGKYTPDGSTLTITAEAQGDVVAIAIADEGPGIPGDETERIFTKFHRAAATAGIAGTGLGLAICRGFVEAHGGTITAANRTERSGAVFTLVLPSAPETTNLEAPLTGSAETLS